MHRGYLDRARASECEWTCMAIDGNLHHQNKISEHSELDLQERNV